MQLAEHLDGTAIDVAVEGLPTIRAAVAAGRLSLVTAGVGDSDPKHPDSRAADATIAGSPLALWQLARGQTAERGSSNAAQVRGDAEVANSYRRLFTLARPDVEEELSRLVGDFPARRLSLLATRTLAWARHARRTAGENVAEYLQEESRDLVNKPELQEFLHNVDRLREMADRIEARLSRLEQRVSSSPKAAPR